MAVQTPAGPVAISSPSVTSPVPSSSEVVEFAGWGRRFSAWLIDWAIFMGVLLVVAVPIAFAVGDTSGEATGAMVGIVGLPIVFAYFALLNGRGQTIGKRMLALRVVDAETLLPIGVGRGALRELIRVGLFALLYIGFFIDGLRPLWHDRRQTWHDSAARSIVIRDQRAVSASDSVSTDVLR